MTNPDGTIHPATFQPDLCDALTPATVCVWLRRQAIAANARGDTALCFALGIAARKVEQILDVAPPTPAAPTPADEAPPNGEGGPGSWGYGSERD